MVNKLRLLFKKLILFVPLFLLLVSCGVRAQNNVTFALKGDKIFFAESDESVYWLSSIGGAANPKYYIRSFNKEGKKNWEISQTVSGGIFPLKSGEFFYAGENGDITAYSKSGEELFKTHVDVSVNSNYMLNSNEELVVNTISSPTDFTVYSVININGEKTTSPEIKNLTTCFMHTYPLGGYIAEGFIDYDETGGYTWYIYRLKDDFSIEWTYRTTNGDKNIYIADISKNGNILFSGSNYKMDIAFLKELDSQGEEINSVDYQKSNIVAAYFNEKIVVSADKLRILSSDFTSLREFDAMLYTKIKVLEKSFFTYSPGSYSDFTKVVAVEYNGYCRQYDENNTLILNETYKSQGFTEISEDGKLYFIK